MRVLTDVLGDGVSLTIALERHLASLPVAERALCQALAYGVLRWLGALEHRLEGLLRKPPRARDLDVKVLLLIGLYQLEHLRIPDHAVVSETVATAEEIGKGWAKALVNATLRRALDTPAGTPPEAAVAHAHPEWLTRLVRAAWPEDWLAVLRAGNARAPMTLRVNLARCPRETYLGLLRDAGMLATATSHAAEGIRLAQPVDVADLPHFDEGWVSVQDEASQLAADLLAAAPGERVLDACAAPGGKSAHLLERAGGRLDLVCIDANAQRTSRLRDNLARLGVDADVRCADALTPRAWWDGKPFDRILLDAPCSASGVIRRHPDIKWLRRASDLDALAETQRALLETLWPLLAGGGTLLYATCSILPRENHEQVESFILSRRDALEHALSGPWGRATRAGRQILPGEDDMDGFFYARLEKR